VTGVRTSVATTISWSGDRRVPRATRCVGQVPATKNEASRVWMRSAIS
jgi:hypothetical protein